MQYVLQQYGKALKDIREAATARQDSTRDALISALLILCFESLHGDIGRAMDHIQSAIDMLIKQVAASIEKHWFSRLESSRPQFDSPAIDED